MEGEYIIWVVIGVFGAGLAFIFIRVLFAARGIASDPSGSFNWGGLLLLIAVAGGGTALFMDTSVETGFGSRVNNLGLMKDQQNYLMVCGVMAIIGTILIVRRR